MTRTRTGVAALALLAALGLVAGCKTGEADQPGAAASTATSPSAPAVDARTALTSAIAASSTQSFTFTLKSTDPQQGPVVATGSYTPDPKTASMKLEQGITLQARRVDDTSYVKVSGMPNLPGKWMKIDTSKLGSQADRSLVDLTGPNDVAKVFNAITDVKDEGDGTYSGTIDMTKATDSQVMTKDDYARYGAKAKSVAFTASLDDQGRFTRIALTVDPRTTFTITYADWGAAKPVTAPPAADVVDAPDFAYQLFQH